jgi:hypothetical protein
VLEFGSTYKAAGQYDVAMGTIKWALDWLVKAHVKAGDSPAANAFVGQVRHMVGDVTRKHVRSQQEWQIFNFIRTSEQAIFSWSMLRSCCHCQKTPCVCKTPWSVHKLCPDKCHLSAPPLCSKYFGAVAAQ